MTTVAAQPDHRAPAAPGRAGRPGVPISALTVLYDAQCSLCVHLRQWLHRQRQLVPLRLVPAGSREARELYPGLDHPRTLREITVIGDRGQIFSGSAAWIVCLWALAEHRPKAHWLATPAGAPFVRATMLAAAKYRELAAPQSAAAPEAAAAPAGPGPAAAVPASSDPAAAVPGTGDGPAVDPGAGGGPAVGPPCDDRCDAPR
ncbi:thiol-disulfide oxidoreductase DCC family protein [Streptomyces sp. NPDC055078]